MHQAICFEKMVQKKPLSAVETHPCDSLLFFVESLMTSEVEPKVVYDKLYTELDRKQIINSDYLLEVISIICRDPLRLKNYWPKLKEKIILNLKETHDPDFYKSQKKTEKILRFFTEKDCSEIRETIEDMRKKSLSEIENIQ